MGSQGPGRRRTPNRNGLSAEGDALSMIARQAESRLAAKRAARAEAREIRMRELERKQKEMSDDDEDEQTSIRSRSNLQLDDRLEGAYSEKGSSRASALSAATLTSLGENSSRIGSGDSSVTADTEVSVREIKEIHDLKDQIQDVETKYVQSLKDAKDALAEMEEKYRKAMVSNAQFDNEKTNLMYQVDTLKDSLSELEELLSESRRDFEEKSKDLEKERHAHSILQFQFNELKETLKKSEELLTKHGIVLGPDLSTIKEVGDGVTDEPACTQALEKSSILGTQEMQPSRDENVEGRRGGQDQQPQDIDDGMQKKCLPLQTQHICSEPFITTQSDDECIDNGLKKHLNQIQNNAEKSLNVLSEAQVCTLSSSKQIKGEKEVEGDSERKAGGLEAAPFTAGPVMTDRYESPISSENSKVIKEENPTFTDENDPVAKDKIAIEQSSKIDQKSEQPPGGSTPNKKKKKKKKNKQKQKKTSDEKECEAQCVVAGSCGNRENSLEVKNTKGTTQEESDSVEPETDGQIRELAEGNTVKPDIDEMATQEGQIMTAGLEDVQYERNITVDDKCVMTHSHAEIITDNSLREKNNQECQEPSDDALESKEDGEELECEKSSKIHDADADAMSDITTKSLSVKPNQDAIGSKLAKDQQDHTSDGACADGQQQICENHEPWELTDAQDGDTSQALTEHTEKQESESAEGEQQASIEREDQLILTEEEHGVHQLENEEQKYLNHQEITDIAQEAGIEHDSAKGSQDHNKPPPENAEIDQEFTGSIVQEESQN